MADNNTVRALKALGPEMDKNKLLLLGLNLLNKGLKLPCAIVRPQTAPEQKDASQLAEKLKSSYSSPPELSTLLQEGTRKRKRESTTDEQNGVGKREKRKMMNRVSAQNARDRKRVYVEDLERKIALLEEKNKLLQKENEVLKKHTSTLSHENDHLEHQLNDSTIISQGDMLQALLKETLLQEPFAQGSAVPQHKVSPQQKQFLKKWLLLQIVLAFNLSYWQTSSRVSSPQQQLLYSLEEELPAPVMSPSNNHQPLLRESPWWGAKDPKWNPPKKN